MLRSLARKAFSPKYLFWTNTGLGIAYLTAADTIQQTVIEPFFQTKKPQTIASSEKDVTAHQAIQLESLDLERSRAMLVGGTVVGSLGHAWYTFLDKKFPGRSRSMIVKKLACEVAAGPPFGVIIFTTVGVVEGKSIKECLEGFKNNIFLFCLADWGFYVPLQFLNFYFLPPKYRFLFVSGISLIYDIFLSFILHRDDEPSSNDEDDHKKTSKEKVVTSSSSSIAKTTPPTTWIDWLKR